ncbi:unnamed protein product [Phyllotreta striolata]|uniref:Uncharacterized protein n=1 Tax=Phyllotreta striolata TaxID=444603 RepID=A0A9N9TUF2_PHYSR|nr:unnamed protein product [Phyllotreta striolata]
MFKLVVLFALVAMVAAKPSGLFVETYSAPLVHAVPAAVSHTYRQDVISKPAVVAYSAPAVVHAEPVVHAAPIVHAVPAAVSYSHRSDVISKPVIAAYSAPVLAYSSHPCG